MTSREIVLANLERANPPRPGMNFSDGRLNDLGGGSLGPSRTYKQKRWVEGNIEYYDDPWGNIWFRMVDRSQLGEVYEPALKDWRQLEDLQLPDFDDPARYEHLKPAFARQKDKFRLAGMPGWVFASARYLRKMETYFADLLLYREEVERLHRKIVDLLIKVLQLYAECGADAIVFAEDLGTQEALLMSPDTWREVFKPHYERLVGTAHELGMRVFMHSCGYDWEIIDDLIEVGIDAFQFDQPALYDMPALAAKLREAKVVLWSPVDIQRVLPTGDEKFIRSEAKRMVDLFSGGLICKNYPDLHGIGVKPEWDQWAYEALCEAAHIDPATGERLEGQ